MKSFTTKKNYPKHMWPAMCATLTLHDAFDLENLLFAQCFYDPITSQFCADELVISISQLRNP